MGNRQGRTGPKRVQKQRKVIKRSCLCKLHKNDLYFFTLNNGTGTINNIDIRHKKVYDTNMEPVPITNRGDSYNRDRKTKIGTGYTTRCGHISL